MSTPEAVLQQYWGYDSFRPLQREIIESILTHHDTLGLMPTGGGKSITFQVPALMLPGVTLVVTPLISLMKDQVDNLRAHDIPAAALHSGLSRREHTLALTRARLGKIKLLYVSPEKLQSKYFINDLSHIDISLIVVDEAHCISQWGYDFRPSYLKIADIRKFWPGINVLALTASATPEVTADIMQRLNFNNGQKFAMSFSRSNISYIVRHTDLKEEMALKILQATHGTAIIYVRSRRRCREIADYLKANRISADFYHAGLSPEEKNDRQNRWHSGETRVIVATNAFGMGIDKPDVRVVIHIDPPSSLEEYYQEAGRAGRDGLPSYAVLLCARTDKALLTKRLNESFPDKDFIARVYELACNFMDIAVGSGYNQVYEFNFQLFCERFQLRPNPTRNALLILSRAGYFDYVDEVATRSRVMILADKRELYSLQLDSVADSVLQTLLRSYPGLFADYVIISEGYIARQLNITEQQVYDSFLRLAREKVLHYVPKSNTPYIFMPTSRELPRHLRLSREAYEDMRARMKQRIEAMKAFMWASGNCRVSLMLKYFGETNAQPCGSCDVCREHRKQSSVQNTESMRREILRLVNQGHTNISTIAYHLSTKVDILIPLIRQLADEGSITISPQATLHPTKN